MGRKKLYPARQERSRASLQRLLNAAEEILEREGLERATVPRIAAHAGFSPANIYRRFPDKNALLQAVFERFFERVVENSAPYFEPQFWDGVSTAEMARRLIAATVRSYRVKPGLVRAIFRYTQQEGENAFCRHAESRRLENFRRAVQLFLARKAYIGHPEPELAVPMAFMMVSFSLSYMFLVGGEQKLRPIVPLDDQSLERELSRAFLAYLQIKDPMSKKQKPAKKRK